MAEESSELELRTTDDDFVEEYSDEAEDSSGETEQLKAQIEETRSQMGETIDAIQEKLSISNITEQVKEQITEEISNVYESAKKSAYGATIIKAGNFMKTVGKELSNTNLGKAARNNPFPLFLIGLGVGLLAYQNFSGKKNRSYASEKGGNSRGFGLKSAQKRIGSAVSDAYGTVSNAASSALEGVSGATSSAYQTVGDKASSAYQSLSGAAGTAYEKVGDFGTQTRETYDHYIEENPLAVGAVALAVGAAVGFAIPSTDYESELMGEYREQVFDKAKASAGDLVERVKTVANEAVQTVQETVKEEIKSQDLTN